MNLEKIDLKIREAILDRKECIAFFVYQGEYVWIIDWDENFNLDHMKNIEAVCEDAALMQHLPEGKTVTMYKAEIIERYRSGIPTLTPDLFPKYRDGQLAKIVSSDLLHDEFFSEDDGQYTDLSFAIERELSFNTAMTEDLVQLRSRLFAMLPKFYINYDRKIFMHMVRGRSYDAVVLDGWWGAEGDFEHMIPTSHRYWVRSDNEDYWAITNFSE